MINKGLRAGLHALIEGNPKVISQPLIIGKPSPGLVQCGVQFDHDITITRSVVKKALRHEKRDAHGKLVGHTGHGLSEELVLRAIGCLDHPSIVVKGNRQRSLLVITEVVDRKNRSIVIALEIGRREAFVDVTSIRSIHGRDNFESFLKNCFTEKRVLGIDMKRADEMLRSIEKTYLKENTFISLG